MFLRLYIGRGFLEFSFARLVQELSLVCYFGFLDSPGLRSPLLLYSLKGSYSASIVSAELRVARLLSPAELINFNLLYLKSRGKLSVRVQRQACVGRELVDCLGRRRYQLLHYSVGYQPGLNVLLRRNPTSYFLADFRLVRPLVRFPRFSSCFILRPKILFRVGSTVVRSVVLIVQVALDEQVRAVCHCLIDG